ncbi:MAG TPA: polysaccharide lyase family protein [Candidatus Acidoferrales bacterium]|nr:polysaccharide lyase family protein [Candidatus Acidoferrales bacterium]
MKVHAVLGAVRMTLLAVAIGCVALAARGQSILWQIGEFNHSSVEFNHDFDFDKPNSRVLYTIGQSKTADWPAYQPGSSVAELKNRTFPYDIAFSLPERPSGSYLLTISFVINRPRYPNLLVEVNGKKGLYYVHRQLSDYPGDEGVDSPIYGEAQLEIPLPASLLHVGKNTLTLTAMDDPVVNSQGLSYLIYDAIRLAQDLGSPSRLSPSVSLDPTVFFREKGSELYEQTGLTVTLPGKVQHGSVEFLVGNQHFRAPLSRANDFGQQRFSFDVRALDKPAEAHVLLRVNGRSRRFDTTFLPARKWTIDFVPHAHLDIGYTDLQPKVAEVQARNIDKLLAYIPHHPDMRFSLDGSWIVQNYMATRNAAAQKQFFGLVREGKIGVPAQYANLLTGYASLEELIRSADLTYALHRSRGIPFDYANITDVPSQTWSYPSVLRALGLKYFAAAANSDRAPILLYGHWNTKSPFWWQGPDGARVLMAYTRQYSQFYFVCNLPPQMANCEQALPTFLETFKAPDYKPDTVLMYGSQFENTDLQLSETDFAQQWNSKYAYPKFVITTFPDYFRYIDKRYGSELPTVVGDGGPYWEDGIGSDARFTAIDRDDQQRALSAEKLSTIATFLDPNLAPPRTLIAGMWRNLVLYAEHTFDSWDSVYRPDSEESKRQLAVKNQYVRDGQEEVNSLAERSLSQIADDIHMPAGTFLVFNTLSWQRSGLVRLDLDDGMTIAEYPGMKPVPVEVVRKGPGYSRVRFLAHDVPALGFTCYKFVQQDKKSSPLPVEEAQPASVIENAFYRVEVDPATGAVTSIFDKQLNKELVDHSSPFKLDQYLYVSGGGEGRTQIVYLQKSLPLAKLTVHPSTGGHVVGLRKTPYGKVLTVESRDANTPSIRTEIMLFDSEKKIEFVNHFTKEAVGGKEAVYFSFPLAIDKPEFAYEIQNGWVDPKRDMLKGAGVEWFSVHHWVKVSNSNLSVALVPVDAPLVTLGDINRGAWPEKFDPKSSTVFSYALNNYWHTNYRGEQGGDFTFRYVLTSSSHLSPGGLARLGRSAMTPLEVQKVVDQDKYDDPSRPLPPAPAGFLEVSAPDVIVENWKAANDGQGSILRLLETGGEASKSSLTFPLFDLQHAWISNAVEENQEELRVSGSSVAISIEPHQILTLRIAAALKSRQ